MNGKKIVSQLNNPRELCETCYNWLTQDDVGFNDLPHCVIADCEECRNYLLGHTKKCSKYLNL